jgi:hypothetical protein
MTAVNFGEQLFHAEDDSDQDQPTWRQAPSLLGAVERAEPFGDHQWSMGSVATMLLLEPIWSRLLEYPCAILRRDRLKRCRRAEIDGCQGACCIEVS